MKRRARRIPLGAAALVAVLLAIPAVANWGTLRDHVEAWHFQLTRDTKTIQPNAGNQAFDQSATLSYMMAEVQLHHAAKMLRCPLIFDPQEVPYVTGLMPSGGIELLQACDYRVLEQRFPRRAYIVIRLSDEELYQRGLLWGGIRLQEPARPTTVRPDLSGVRSAAKQRPQ